MRMRKEANEDDYYANQLDQYLHEDYYITVDVEAILAQLSVYLKQGERWRDFFSKSWDYWENLLLNYADEKSFDTFLDLDNVSKEQSALYLANQILPTVGKHLDDLIESWYDEECYITDEMWSFATREYY